jgi:hypothetical protein
MGERRSRANRNFQQEGIMMKGRLTVVERQLVEEILKQQHEVYDRLADQLEGLRVVSREPTGVGAYINFSSPGPVQDKTIDTELGFRGQIEIEGIPMGLGCVLAVTAGRLHYLELFVYGDLTWDGNLDDARIIPAK